MITNVTLVTGDSREAAILKVEYKDDVGQIRYLGRSITAVTRENIQSLRDECDRWLAL